MKAMNIKALNAAFTKIINCNSEEHLQEVFCNLVHHALVHGNASLERMAALRNSKAPAKFKSALLKHMPVKWDKTAQQYGYDKDKATKLRVELMIQYGVDDFELTCAALPFIFEKAERQAKEFVLADYLAQVAKKLDKEGIANADDLVGLVSLLANNPDATKAAIHAAYNKTAGTVETNVA